MTIKGYIEHIIYRNSENGYTVCNFVCEEEEIICVGSFRSIDVGETLSLTGDFVDHATYGSQFKVEGYELIPLEDAASIARYLGSGAIKGIGPALAARIVKKFGDETFRIMEQEPERLSEIRGISDRIGREIALQMEEKRELRNAMVFLQKYNISNTLAIKIYEKYGMNLYQVIRNNPYQLADDIQGVGFRIADEIASKIGIHTDSDYRIRSALLYVLLQATQEGHTYLPLPVLLTKTAELLELEEQLFLPQIDNLLMDRKLIRKEDAIYAANYYYSESNCAKMLLELASQDGIRTELLPAEEQEITKQILLLEEELSIHLDELQRSAVLGAICNGVFLLSGGPGTGKTTTINLIIRYFEREGKDMILAAPTGRASKRMTEATGFEAKTIHRLLELNSGLSDGQRTPVFERNEENPLEADVIIIDEMSMVDIHLFQSLLRAVMPGTHLILVGDVNQLPSVGPGQVLKDLLESNIFASVILKKIFRQEENSHIVLNAHRIHMGQEIEIHNKSSDFFFLERSDPQVIYKHMIQLILEKLPPYVKANPYDIQVLTPMRKGNLGVEVLNKILQEYLNPPSPKKKEHSYGDTLFRMGDKVMQIKNNYQLEWEVVSRYGIPIDKGLGVFNGDIGIIKEMNEFAQTLTIEFDEMKKVQYSFQQLEELELAYAITIHKSQGSEYPAIIIPLLGGPRMLLNRNLLYTGVTRGRNCVTILGSRETLNTMIANENEQKRYTSLSKRLKEIVEL